MCSNWTQGNWNAYIAQFKHAETIKAELENIPEKYREKARQHARTVWRLRGAKR